MREQLKNRLRRYLDTRDQDSRNQDSLQTPAAAPIKTVADRKLLWPGWTEVGFNVYKRKITAELSFSVPAVFPASLALLVPDFSRVDRLPRPEELLFFDLETTGLSGGAGTIAFLAAFGRFTPSGIEITQYLLLDYPGEGDFIANLVSEFALSPPPWVVTYNGKSFDAQILKTRCLMNGITPLEFFHADLLYPARRLWKRKLPDCSQVTIEVSALGLDRSGDISGALAPEIWFSFLRNGDNDQLLSVCDHNIRDIQGLACLFLALAEIAAAPIKSRSRFFFDEEALALYWRKAVRRRQRLFVDDEFCRENLKTAELLLETAAKNGHPRAVFTLARSLAIDAEWRLGDYALALHHTESALVCPELSADQRNDLKKRQKRLNEKLK